MSGLDPVKVGKTDKIDFVSLQVRDLKVSQQFYTEVLGLEVLPQIRPDAVIFKTEGGAEFAVRTPMVDLDAVPRLGWGVAIWLATRDVDAVHERVRRGGSPVLRPLQDGPFGRMFVVADPDGYQLTIHQV